MLVRVYVEFTRAPLWRFRFDDGCAKIFQLSCRSCKVRSQKHKHRCLTAGSSLVEGGQERERDGAGRACVCRSGWMSERGVSFPEAAK